jgi:hypothetical protein
MQFYALADKYRTLMEITSYQSSSLVYSGIYKYN